MADYTQTTDFSAKDSLSTGDPEKIILGADFDAEFDAISTAIASKYDSSDIANQAQAEAASANDVLMTPLRLDNWAADNAGMVKDIQALADPGADTLLGWDDSASAAINYTLGDGLTVSGTEITADAGPVDVKYYRLSNIGRQNTTTLADDSNFQGWVIEEDDLYTIEGFFTVSCDSAGVDFKFQWYFDGAGSGKLLKASYQVAVDEGGTLGTAATEYHSAPEVPQVLDIPASGTIYVHVKGFVLGPSSGGSENLSLQWAQNSSNADYVSIGRGSWIKITRIYEA